MSDQSLTEALADQVSRLFERACTRELLELAEAGVWPGPLWAEVEAMGLPRAPASEMAGGHGLPWDALAGVLQALGRHAAPIPLAETMVAAWLLGRVGAAAPEGPIVLATEPAVLRPDGRLHGCSADVAWPGQGDYAVALAPASEGVRVCLVRAPTDRSSELRGTIVWDGLMPEFTSDPQSDLSLDPALPALAVARAAQISGALNRVLALSVTYAGDRRQFGQSIGKFQAMQHMLAQLAMEAAAATSAAAFGLRQLDQDPLFAAAVAKSRASRAAGAGAAFAHQVHGAIGVTAEHDLQLFTRALWRWRDQAGSEQHWSQRLGAAALAEAPGTLWPALIERLAVGVG